jgi:hypothetical protein
MLPGGPIDEAGATLQEPGVCCWGWRWLIHWRCAAVRFGKHPVQWVLPCMTQHTPHVHRRRIVCTRLTKPPAVKPAGVMLLYSRLRYNLQRVHMHPLDGALLFGCIQVRVSHTDRSDVAFGLTHAIRRGSDMVAIALLCRKGPGRSEHVAWSTGAAM